MLGGCSALARGDVALELSERDVRSGAVLLRVDGPLRDTVVYLRPTHSQNVTGLGDLKTQDWKWVRSLLGDIIGVHRPFPNQC